MEQRRNEFIRGPKWRTRTTPQGRGRAAVLTFAVIVTAGGALLIGLIWLLDRLGAPTWLAIAPWFAPTAGAVIWAMLRPAPAVATDDDDDSWAEFAIRYVVIGENTPRPAPARIAAAALFGAPVVWALIVIGLLTLTGLL